MVKSVVPEEVRVGIERILAALNEVPEFHEMDRLVLASALGYLALKIASQEDPAAAEAIFRELLSTSMNENVH